MSIYFFIYNKNSRMTSIWFENTLKWLGWKPFELNKEKYNAKYVCVFSHTSSWELPIYLLYKNAYPQYLGNSYAVIKPQFIDMFPKNIQENVKNMGLIPSTRLEEKGKGFIKTAVELLQNKENFVVFISPKGKRDLGEWRSGYYVLAKELNVPIVACGIDYEKKELIASEPFLTSDYTKEEMDEKLKIELGKIIPLHIRNSEYPITRDYDKNNISLINTNKVIFLLIIILLIFLFRKTLWIVILLIIILFLMLYF